MNILEQTPEALSLQLQAALYNENVVFKCFYWYGDAYDVSITVADGGNSFHVTLRPRVGNLDPDICRALEDRIRRDLIDFKTRDLVAQETRTIRELLVAKAFAHSDEYDAPPPGDISDPLGFGPDSYGSTS